MYLIRFLPNFVAFFVFLGISRDFADLPEFRGSATARNITSPGKRSEERQASLGGRCGGGLSEQCVLSNLEHYG